MSKTIENFVEPRLGQWQCNQSQDLPLLTTPTSNIIALDGNNMVILNNATTQSYTVIPTQSKTPAVRQDAAAGTILNAGTAGQTINLKRANGVIATSFTLNANNVIELKYYGAVDRYRYTNQTTY